MWLLTGLYLSRQRPYFMHTAQKIVNVKSLYLWYNTDVAAVTKSDHLYTGEVTL